MSAADDLANYLAANGAGILGSNLFIGEIPSAAGDKATAVIEAPGMAPVYVHGLDQPHMLRPDVKVVCRDNNRATAAQMARTAYGILAPIDNQTINGKFYLSVNPKGEPYALGRDDNDRFEYHCDYQTTLIN